MGYGRQAGGMHPTGMHSCLKLFLFLILGFVVGFVSRPVISGQNLLFNRTGGDL